MRRLIGAAVGATIGYGLGVWAAYDPSPGVEQPEHELAFPLLLALVGGFGGFTAANVKN